MIAEIQNTIYQILKSLGTIYRTFGTFILTSIISI